MPDLNDLGFFAAVVSHHGFSAAARALGLPKSRVSRRVAALESDLGVRLLERSTRRLNVTQVGQDVFEHARAAMSEAGAIEELAARTKSEPQGLVRVTCPVGVERIITTKLPELLSRYPQLRLQMIVTNQRMDLIDEGVDLAIRYGRTTPADADLQVKVVKRVGAVLVASPGFLQAHGRPLSLADLPLLPTVSNSDNAGPDRWELVDEAGEAATVVHEPRLLASTLAVMRRAVLDGIGVGLLPDFACRDDLAEGRLEPVLPNWRRQEGQLYILYKSRRGLLPGVRAVIDFVADALNPRTSSWDAVL